MNNLIYLPLEWLGQYDPKLLDDSYQHNHWFNMKAGSVWPSHLTSRVHKLDTPWDLAPTICPMPILSHTSESRFEVVLDSITDRLCSYVQATGKTPYVSWSGGIDSTSIMVSLLRVASADFLKKLVVLHNQRSIQENTFFYYRFIAGKITTVDFDQTPFDITADNYDKIVILDGDAGNQVMGSPLINSLMQQGNQYLLDQDWCTVKDYNKIIPGATEFQFDIIRDSVPLAPVQIRTVFDLLWWIAYNFRIDDVLLRKMPVYIQNLTSEQSREFWNSGIFRHYAQPEMQQWSLTSLDRRRKSLDIMLKYIPKKYIYDFDHNDVWYAHKTEQGSLAQSYENCQWGQSGLIALDSNWNKYRLADSSTRRNLGSILGRI